jgi:membrane protein
VLKNYHVAVVSADGSEPAELSEPLRVLKEAGAQVEVVDGKEGNTSPQAYDAVLVPDASPNADPVRLDVRAHEFVRAMRQAGKPVLCAPVQLASQPETKAPEERHSIWSIAKEVITRFLDSNAPRLGAALAYYTVFSMAPLLVVVVGIAGLAFGKAAAEGQIVWQLQNTVGPEGAKAIQALLAATQRTESGIIATLVGLVVLLFGASGVFAELRDSLNLLWGVKTPGAGFRGLVMSRFFSFAMVLAVGFLLLVSLVLSAILAAVGKYLSGYLPVNESVLHLLSVVASFLVFTAMFALLYKLVPDLPVAWNDVWIGAAVTSLLFSIGKFVIGFYIGKAALGSAYGAAGSLVIFLAWVYYSAQIFFLGAEFTHLYATRRGSHSPEGAAA